MNISDFSQIQSLPLRERCGGFVSQIRNGNSRNYRIR